MGNKNHGKTGHPEATGHESAGHTDLKTREKHLNELIIALKQTGMQISGDYYAGYSSYNPNSQFSGKSDGFSLA